MYIPPAKTLRADPISQTQTAYANLSHFGTKAKPTTRARDRFSMSDETRLREEYNLRLTQEGRFARTDGEDRSATPTLIEMARLYAVFWDDIHLTFRDSTALLTLHIQALDLAFRDTLSLLARLAAEHLGRREGDLQAANVPLLEEIIRSAHRRFADVFCKHHVLSGVERAIVQALMEAIKVLTLVQNQDLSLSDTMALLYYRKGLEQRS